MRFISSFALVTCLLSACAVPSASAVGVNCKSPKEPWVDAASPTLLGELKGYWPLSKDWRDYSGGLKHLTTPVHALAKKPTLQTSGGPTGGGYTDFDHPASGGPMNVLAVESYDASSNDDSYTWEFWFKVDSRSGHAGWFLSYAVPGDANKLFISTGHVDKYTCEAGKQGEVRGPTDRPKLCDQGLGWKHFAYVVDATDGTASQARATVYIDGEILASELVSTSRIVQEAGTLAFGAELDSGTFPDLELVPNQILDGGMAEVRNWGKAMNQDEIKDLMNTSYSCETYTIGSPCTDDEEDLCHPLAYCEQIDIDNAFKPRCRCPAGLYGDGFGPLGCHAEVPKVTCNPASTEENNSTEVRRSATPARRSGVSTIVSGPVNLGGYWPLSVSSGFEDKSGKGHDMSAVNAGPDLKNDDANSPFSDGFAEFDPAGRTLQQIEGLAVEGFDTQLAGTDGSYTWEFWMRVDDTNTQWFISYAVGARGSGTSRGGAGPDNEFFMSTGHGAAGKCDAGVHGAVRGEAKVCGQSTTWRHVAFVHDGTAKTGTLYVDGIQQNQMGYTLGAMRTGGTLMFGGELDNTDVSVLSAAVFEPSQFLKGAMTEVRYWTEARSSDQILDLMNFRLIHLECGEYVKGEVCDEAQSKTCHYSANCESIDDVATCFCEMGMIGTGYADDSCRTKGWAVRTVYENVEAVKLAWLSDPALVEAHVTHFKSCFGSNAVHFQRGVAPFSDAMHFPYAAHSLMVNALFDNEPNESEMEDHAAKAQSCFPYGEVGSTGTRLYTWVYGTTAREQQAPPTGLTIDAVSFETSGCETGCWVIDVTYTTGGKDAFNSFYLPNAVGDDTASYDFDYDENTDNTFLPKNFPCRTHEYILADGSVPESLPDELTTCCLVQAYTDETGNPGATQNGFVMDYRPTQAFVDWVDEMEDYLCQGRDFPSVAVLDRSNYNETEANPSPFIDVNFPWHSTVPHRFLDGQFKGMPNSPGVVSTTTLDPFFYQYSATIKLDEVELRQLAGKLRGTVGVEHTVDTFLGFVNFRPTGLPVVDAFATQANIHLEKTNFFSVSTHGENAYTFLEYVNMRLISIYNQDIDFSGLNESADRTVRTDSSGNANYVQVTFTMGAQYAPNLVSGGLIPLDSVRAGRGTFISGTTLEHLCMEYTEGNATAGDDIGLTGYADDIQIFNDMLDQPSGCAPRSNMCVSPETVPDQFVSFNIPLGFQVFDGQASNSLENNIFVSMVINALDKMNAGPNPNGGDNPMQMKTTLEASIPIVDGGVNIFCDGITAKTDLKDVASADIIVGSAASRAELTRLRILQDIANTNLDSVSSARIDSDSIQAGLMTLVLKGDSSYFQNGVVNSQGYSLELDDLITIHLMTDGEAPDLTDDECAAAADPKPVDCRVRALLAQAPEDNSNSNGLDTDGYKLNGAFKFVVARGDGIAVLEPTSDLLAMCPFNPTRPSGGLPLESCITRRDVRSRKYPVRQGADGPTAMEILAQKGDLNTDNLVVEKTALEAQKVPDDCACSDGDDCCEAGFLQMILGENNYARPLAIDFVKAIDDRYKLNGRYNRAYWINPGYEWTPTQTAGKSIFSVSQKLYLFALITMDENIGGRRRMLLATDVNPTKDSGSGVGGGQVSFPVARTSIMAQALDVPAENAVVFNVEMQLTQAEACMSDVQFVEAARQTFMDYLENTASDLLTVQILGFTRSPNGVSCSNRRALRKLLADFSAATADVQMLIVYKDGRNAVLNDKAFADMPGITSVAPDAASARNVKIDPTYVNKEGANPKDTSKSDSGSSSNTALIAGIAGGIGGAVLLLIGAMLFMRSRGSSATPVAEPVQTINVSDLKAQLSESV